MVLWVGALKEKKVTLGSMGIIISLSFSWTGRRSLERTGMELHALGSICAQAAEWRL